MRIDLLAVGIDNYFDAAGRVVMEKSLRFAASDAGKIFRTLTYLFDVRHASQLTDGPQSRVSPTRNAIIRELRQLGEFEPHDLTTLFVYFAGHGVGIDGVLHLCPSDFDSEIREYSSLSMGLLCDLISKRRGKTCLILDCCRAVLGDSTPATPRLSRVSVPIGDDLTILIACSDGQSSYEANVERYPGGGGVFTGEILAALDEQARASAGEYFSLGEVFRAARDSTVQYVFDKTGSACQKPIVIGGDIDEFFLESRGLYATKNTSVKRNRSLA